MRSTGNWIRGGVIALGVAGCLAMPIAGVAIAEEEHGAAGGEHHAKECPSAPGEAADEECLEYWEDHINWFSWDYKAPVEQPEHRHMPPPFGFALINFFVFASIIYRLAATPLKDFVRARHTTIRKDLDDAAAIHREAEAKLRQYEARMAGMNGEIQTLLAEVRTEAEAEKKRIIASAEKQAERLKIEAQQQIENEIQRVRRELKVEAVGAALAVAEKLLREKTGAQDATLTERFIVSLESGDRTGAPPPGPGSIPPAKSVATN